MTDAAVVRELSDASFDAAIGAGDEPWLVDFWAEWCAPCHAMIPVLDELAAELDGRVRIGKLDTSLNPQTAARYDIQTLPTLLVLSAGTVARRIYGVKSKRQLLRLLGEVVDTAPSVKE